MSTLGSEIYGMPNTFPEHLGEYCSRIAAAIRQNKHHDQRLGLLLDFLRKGFSLEVDEIDLQRKVKAGSVRGRIDAFFRFIIFEMKCDLERERRDGRAELKKYFESQDDPHKYIGVISDGRRFEVYQYFDGEIDLVRAFDLQPDRPAAGFQLLDELLGTRPKIPATSDEICLRFGLDSVVLARSLAVFSRAFESVRKEESVRTKFREWDALLAKVYGSRTEDRQMFLKHTYLAFLSRCIVVQVLFPTAPRNAELYRGIIDGRSFRERNIQNLAEEDFFSWCLGNEAEADTIDLIANLFRHLDAFRFDELDQDLLKMLYQELVEPADRHNLGEYYTPDWLAQLTLDEIDYRGGRLLDPACGSGTFLYFAIRRLRQGKRRGARLVSYALDNVVGIDVHPVATLMAKANFLIALGDDLNGYQRSLRLPVYLADTLLTGEDLRENAIQVPAGKRGAFRIPLATLERERPIDDLIDALVDYAHRGIESKEAEKGAIEAFAKCLKGFEKGEDFLWRQNFRHMVKLIRAGSDTVWAFILKNAYRPAYLRKHRVQYVVGNPPWLSYRFIEDEDYKAHVRRLTFDYGLLEPTQRKLFTQIDISTLFLVHCEREFLEDGGTIAFVMPKSVIVPSQQHAGFQKLAFSALHDFSSVSPLFNVRSCLIIRRPGESPKSDVPMTVWRAVFDHKNPKMTSPRETLERETTKHRIIRAGEPASPYYQEFSQGATLVPRCLWFAEHPREWPLDERAPYLRTTRAVQSRAKPPWEVELKGKVERQFIFSTVLCENLLPFGIRGYSLVVLPIKLTRDGSLLVLDHHGILAAEGPQAHDWVRQAQEIWETHKKPTQPRLYEYIDWQQKLTRQNLDAPSVVIYNKSGTNLVAALVRKTAASLLGKVSSSGFVADHVTYFWYPSTAKEGHYLVGTLNSETVNHSIKPFQTQGLYGPRDIHRRPFEVCPIPRFDKKNDLHQNIAAVAREAERKIKRRLPQLEGPVARARAEARHIVKSELEQLDDLVERLLRPSKSPPSPPRKRGNPGSLDLLSGLL